MMRWVLLYGDGSVFSSEEGTWEEAPGRDVQVGIYLDAELGWTLRHGGDFVRMAEDGTLVAMDETGMIDHVVHELGVVKQGRMLEQAKWDAVYRRALLLREELMRGRS